MVKQGFLFNKFSSLASKRANNIRNDIISDLKLKRSDVKSLNVLVIILDSVSRAHAYRMLPKTIEFLNKTVSKSEEFLIYDFLINNGHGENTTPNITPLLYGFDLNDFQTRTRGWSIKRPLDKLKFESLQTNFSLWKHYEKHGFVTMFGFETKSDYFAEITGRKILTDHIATSF